MTTEFPVRYAGPHVIKSLLIEENISCRVIDFVQTLSIETLKDLIQKNISDETLVLGFSTTFWNTRTAKSTKKELTYIISDKLVAFINELKTKFKKLTVCVGGANAKRVASSNSIVDACFEGYSDDSFLDYVHSLNNKKSVLATEYINDTCKVFKTASLPTRNRNGSKIVFNEYDYVTNKEPLPLELARGCIFKCKFCNYPNIGKTKLDYIRDISEVKEDLIRNYENHGTTIYNFLDDTYNDSVFKLESFGNMIATLPFKIQYTCYLRADLLCRFPEMTSLLKDTGLVSCFFGIESLHREASRLIGKGWSGSEAKDYIPELHHNIWKKSVNTQMGFIVGLPKETVESVENTFEWLTQNKLNGVFYGLNLNSPYLDSQSELTKNSESYGIAGNYLKWVSDYFDSNTAAALANKLNAEHSKYRLIDNWRHTSFLALGFSQDTLMTQSGVSLEKEAYSLGKDILEKYQRNLLNEVR